MFKICFTFLYPVVIWIQTQETWSECIYGCLGGHTI